MTFAETCPNDDIRARLRNIFVTATAGGPCTTVPLGRCRTQTHACSRRSQQSRPQTYF